MTHNFYACQEKKAPAKLRSDRVCQVNLPQRAADLLFTHTAEIGPRGAAYQRGAAETLR